jgi:hypothetical protein
MDDPLRDTTPISLSSDSMSLSSDSDSRPRSPGHRRPRGRRSPGNYPGRYKNRAYYLRGNFHHNEYRTQRSRSPSFNQRRPGSPRGRFRRSPSPSYRQRRRSRSPGRPPFRRGSGSDSPEVLGSRSPVRTRSPIRTRSPVRTSRSPSMTRADSRTSNNDRRPWGNSSRGGSQRGGFGRGSRHDRDRSPSPDPLTKKRDKWTKFREEADALEVEMEETRQFHQKNPEKHPMYKDEWKKFWNKRFQELQAEGKDPTKHDYKPEWIAFWNQKMEDMHNSEFKLRKDALKKKFELNEEDEGVYRPRIRLVQARPDDASYGYAGREPGPNYRDYDQPGYSGGSVSDVKDTWKALTGGEIRAGEHVPEDYHQDMPPVRHRSPTWAPPNRYNNRGPLESGMFPAYRQSNEGAFRVTSVLRMLTALEAQLGSFGPRINSLLAQAISMDKAEYGSSQDLIRNIDNVVLFESIKEKFKGMLMAGIVDRGNVKATRVAIADLTELLNRAPPPIQNEEVKSAQAAGTSASSAQAVAVPGVGQVDRAAIAMQITEALLAQGKTDVSEADLQDLIDAVIGMSQQTEASEKPSTATTSATTPIETAEKSNEKSSSAKPEVEKPETKTTLTAATKASDALKVIQAAYKREASPVKNPRPVLANVAQISDLCEADLKSCLRIYKHLNLSEQRSLIMYLKKLEEEDPRRVENLRKYVNLGTGTVEESDDESKEPTFRPTSPFSKRKGGSNPAGNDPDSDEDYSFEDVCKAAVRNVDAQQKEDQKKNDIARLKNLNKPADNNAIKQVIQATTDTMIAGLREITSRKDFPPAPAQKPNVPSPKPTETKKPPQQPGIPVQVGQRYNFKQQKQQAQPPQQTTTTPVTDSSNMYGLSTQNIITSASYMQPFTAQPEVNPYMQSYAAENVQYPQMDQYQQPHQQPGYANNQFYPYNQQPPFGGPQQQQPPFGGPPQQQQQQPQQHEMSYHPAQYSVAYEKRQQKLGKNTGW